MKRANGWARGPPYSALARPPRLQHFCQTAATKTTLTVTRRGVVTLPAKLRQALGLKPEDQLIAETTPEGLPLRRVLLARVERERGILIDGPDRRGYARLMTTITFDPLRLVDKLKAAGIPAEQAEAVVRIIAEAQDELVTKAHLESTLEKALASIRTDLSVLKWMMGVLLAGVLSLILKTFF